MPSIDKKVVVVFGATGTQGGSVVRALLHDIVASQQFHIRAITRDPSTLVAAALVKEGAEVVKVSSLLSSQSPMSQKSVANNSVERLILTIKSPCVWP
jgi:hypothetical protein